MQLVFDNNASGSIRRVNSSLGQLGQWYAPYRGPSTSFLLAVTLQQSEGSGVARVDAVSFNGFNTVQGRDTYDAGSSEESVAPAAFRRPLADTAMLADRFLTVVVPVHYFCRPPRSAGSRVTIGAVSVTWELGGVRRTQLMALPEPVIMTGGQPCPGWVPPGVG